MIDDIPPGRPAATVVIVRDSPGAQAQILMVERATTMVFAAGALVFPGGAVDEADRLLAVREGATLDIDEAAARIAAIRETLEESGIAIGMVPTPDEATCAAMREGLATGAALADVMAAHGLTLDLDQLILFARWQPSPSDMASRIYDTRFYIVRAPEGQVASADGSENVHLFWSDAGEILARCDAGAARVIYPTRRNLERLALFGCFDDLAAHAGSIAVRRISPWVEEHEGGRRLCIPGDLGYPVTWEPMDTASRS
ncbi:MAG: NUDIX domain-containing protein [Sphingobium sp.]